jgi:integrase
MASIDRRSDGRWRARWREYPGGPQRSKHFARKADAERHLVNVQHDLLTGAYVDPARSRTTVADFYRTWSARQPWRPSTRESVRTRFDNHVLPVLGARPLGSLRRGDIEAWVAGRRLAPSTAGIALQQLSSLLEAAVADGLIARNPARGVRRPKVTGSLVVPFTAEEIDRLIEAAALSLAVAIVLGARCGLRHGEAAGLTVDRVDFLRRELTVDRQLVTGRSGGLPTSFGPLKTANSYRTVPMADSTVTALAALFEARGAGVDGLLVHEDGRAVNAARFGYLWRQARQRAGVSPIARFHCTRHTFASVLLSEGVSIAATSEYLGDTPGVVLSTYAHLMPAGHDRARAAVEAAFRGAPLKALRTG